MNLNLNIETVFRILAVAVWALAAFGKSATLQPCTDSWPSLLLGLALYAAAPIVGGWASKPKT